MPGEALTCVPCGGPLAVVRDAAGNSSWGHAGPASEDGHKAEAPPVTVTYRQDGPWWHVECDELGNLAPVFGEEPARAMAQTLLARISPPRNLVQHTVRTP